MRLLALLLLSGCVHCEIDPIGPIAKEGRVLLSWVTLAPGETPPCGKRGCTTCMNGVCSIVLAEDPQLAEVCPALRFAHELGHAMGARHH